jgi:hypothetical protein
MVEPLAGRLAGRLGGGVSAAPAVTARRLAGSLAVPAGLYLVAATFYAWAAGLVSFAVNEGSAYYIAVARNLSAGRGLVVDSIWSYATPPLVLPRPAFELWQPLASIIAAAPMTVLGPSLASAQLGMAAFAALLAPLAWALTREASLALDGDTRRAQVLAAGSGLVVVLVGPLVMAVALPDSTIPFAVTATVCCWLVASSLRAAPADRFRLWALLGAGLGVAWLARHEAIWIAFVAVAVAAGAGVLTRRLMAGVLAGGLAVVAPWLLRNLVDFGKVLPGQALDNALLQSNEQIFAYLEPPSLAGFLAQGPSVLVGNVLMATQHNLVNVLVVPAAPVALLGGAGALWLAWRAPAFRRTSLGILLLAGLVILVATTMLFPVATRWGTFEHAAGPLLLALAAAGVLGVDRAVRAVGRRRGWRRSNAWLAPLAIGALLVPLTALQLVGLGEQAARWADHYERLGAAVQAQPEVASGGRPVVVSDRPVWLSDATGLPAIALPAEPLPALIALTSRFEARLLVISDQRGPYPGLLRTPAAAGCFAERAPLAGQPADSAIFEVLSGCR